MSRPIMRSQEARDFPGGGKIMGSPKSDQYQRRGVTIIMVTVMLFVLIVFAALSVDVGHLCAVAAEQQNTADGGALAGASALQDGLPEEVRRRTLEVIAMNQRTQGFDSLDDQVIEIGRFNSVTGEFTRMDMSEADDAFAVRVVGRRADMPYFFAPIMGKHSTNVTREAVAVASGRCGGIWGLEGVTAGGNVATDSYNSRDGSYDALSANNHGDLCSGMGIRVNGSFDVDGAVMAGFGHEVRVSGSAGRITGITTNTSGGLTGPEVSLGDAEYNNDNAAIGLTDDGRSPWQRSGWEMGVSGTQNLNIDPGTYVLDSLRLAGGSSLTFSGPTTIYVRGDVDMVSGILVNTTQDPHNLTIISLGTDVKVSGGAGFYGSIVAPNADVSLGGSGDFYGAVIGKTVDIGGDFVFHVDESLVETAWSAAPVPMIVK
jgi:hypothetical protein